MKAKIALQPRRRPSGGVTLIEMLVCVSIILILTAISLTYHQGALDSGDLKFVMPKIAGQTERFQALARDAKVKVVVDVPRNEPKIIYTVTKGDPVDPIELDLVEFGARIPLDSSMLHVVNEMLRESGGNIHLVLKWDLKGSSLLKRNLVFLDYKYPDGGEEPRTFTFFPDAKPQGGEVRFGSRMAAAKLFLAGDRIQWSM